MKRLLLPIVTALLFTAACSQSVDSLITKYEKACEKGAFVEASNIMLKLQEHEDELSEEQLMKITSATAVLEGKVIDNTKDLYDSATKALDSFSDIFE